MAKKATIRICEQGHKYYKSSDCPTCPVCENENKPADGFLSLLASPARRALLNQGIDSLTKLSNYSEDEILKLHGVGKTAIPVLKKALSEKQLKLRNG